LAPHYRTWTRLAAIAIAVLLVVMLVGPTFSTVWSIAGTTWAVDDGWDDVPQIRFGLDGIAHFERWSVPDMGPSQGEQSLRYWIVGDIIRLSGEIDDVYGVQFQYTPASDGSRETLRGGKGGSYRKIQ